MNSNRDPMLAPGQDGMMMFDNAIDETMQGQDVFLGNAFADQGDLMDDMFATSPQSSTMRMVKDQPAVQPSHTTTGVPPAGSSPEDSSEDSSSDDSARHQRKSSSMSFQTDIDMVDGMKYGVRSGFHQATMSSDLSRGGFAAALDSDMVNEAMANDFDFDSAASSPDPIKSPNGSSTVMRDGLHMQPGQDFPNGQTQMHRSAPIAQVKTESMASLSPPMASRKSPSASAGNVFGGAPSASASQTRGRMHIHPIPHKSRVETQIPMKITVMPMPEGVEKLHLPTHTISKPKLIARPTPEPSPDMLELHSMLVCTSAMRDPAKKERAFRNAAAKTREMEAKEKDILPREEAYSADDPENPLNGGEVHICRGCITRERKRAARKKSKKPDDEAAWTSDEARRVVVFNTTEIRQWEDPEDEPDTETRGRTMPIFPPGSKQIKMPMRIACYCRHHTEKFGFQVIITLKDHQGQVVGQAMTAPIIITDDHKAQPLAAGALANGVTAESTGQWHDGSGPGTDIRDPHGFNQLSRNAFSSNDLASLQMTQPLPLNQTGFSPFASAQTGQTEGKANRVNKSRQASPASSGPQAKRRKANAGPKLPESLMMTKAQTAASPTTPSAPTAQFTPSTAASPFGFTFPPGGLPLTAGTQRRTPSFPSGPPTPDSGTNDFWANGARAQSFDTNAQSQSMFSAPSSRMQSRAPSPSTNPLQNLQTAAPRPTQNHGVNAPQTQPAQRAPIINKIVPGEGPIAGGIEVTCLGSGFFNGLEVVFGNSPATTTTYWGETTLVCLLPPADRPGIVPVTFKHNFENFASAIRTVGKQTFTYVDDEEQELFKHAFIALTQKMTGGKAGDPADFARKALGVRETSNGWTAYHAGNGQYRQMASGGGDVLTENMETTVMKCLELIDMDDGPYPADLDMQRSNGQTLLHLAASLGYQRLVAALLARGADPDLCDLNGFSPLHFASLRNHPQIVRRLRFAGANPILRSRLGYTPGQLTTDPFVLQILDSGIHLRSRSFGVSSLASRNSSLQSLALATPPRSRANSMGRYAAQDEWDSSSDEDDEDDVEPLTLVKTRSWRQSRRGSVVLPDGAMQPTVAELNQPVTTAAALIAWRDQLAAQIQQFQHSVEGILPHLQMPTLPTIPPLTGMHNYQAPAMVRRFSSLVPQRSSRPGSPAESTGSSKDGDSKWWHIFPGSQSNPPSPPPYNEIYPEETDRGLDDKARAVASSQARNAKIEEDTMITEQTATVAASSKTELGSEQQEELSMTHVRNVKGLRKDTNFWLIWVPILIVILSLWFPWKDSVQMWIMPANRAEDTQRRIVEV